MFSMLWLLASCQEPELLERPVGGDSEGTVEVTFSVRLPDDALATKAFGESTATAIKSLHLIVFDENGYYIDTQPAELVGSAFGHETHENEHKFKVTLRKTEKERIIHFIANCPVDQIHFGHESDIISNLYVTRGSDKESAYWYRTEVWYIKTVPDSSPEVLVDEIAEKFKCVPLLRNYASITVVDDADDFVMDSYAVYNTIDRGTVAPYNIDSTAFQSFVDDRNVLIPYATLRDTYGYFGHALPSATLKTTLSDADFLAPGKPTYMYERKVSVRAGAEHQWSESPPHIIIKGRYNNAAAYSYYKVDLLRHSETDNKSYYYNILRNFKYTFTIRNVAGPGYTTFEEAMNNPAGNNLSGATDTQGFTNISDGLGRIFVSYTDTTLTSGKDVTLRYKYIPSIVDYETSANGRVKVEGILDGTGSVIKGKVGNYQELTGEWAGWAEITFQVQTPGAITHLQEITLNVEDNANLNKTIRYRLQRELLMEVNCWPQYIAREAGKKMIVAIRLPNDLTKDLFPLDLAIEVEHHTLSPDAEQEYNVMPVEPALSIVPSKSGKRSYHFVKTIETYEDYQALSMYEGKKLVQTHWLTSKAENQSTVYVYNKYFALDYDPFYNVEAFSLLNFPDGVPTGAGKEVEFHFSMNKVVDASGKVIPVTVTLEGLRTADGQKTLTYIPENTGLQKLPKLYTVNESGTVKVTLKAEGYTEEYLEVVQSSEVTIANIVVTFTHASSGAPATNTVTPEITVSGGGKVTYDRVTRKRTGRNPYTYTITFENVVFENVTKESEVTVSYSHQVTNNRGQVTHECTLSGTAKIRDLETSQAITIN